MKGSIVVAILMSILAVSFGIQQRYIPGFKIPSVKDEPEGYDLQNGPTNVADYAEVNITLACSSSNSVGQRIMWAEFVNNPQGGLISDGDTILPGTPYGDRYTIIHDSPTQYDLHITNIGSQDGGTYLCQDVNSGPPNFFRFQAELITIGGTPNCSDTIGTGTVLEGQNHTMECTVSYSGNIAPTVTWSGPPPFRVASATTATAVWSGISFTVDRSFQTLNYQSTTNFTVNPDVPDGVASNAPDFLHTHFSVQLLVYWGPKNMFISPVKPTYDVDDIVAGFADAFPAPSYQWQNMRTLVIITSQNITVDASFVGLSTQMRCQAQNIIGGFVYQQNFFVNITVPAPTTTASPTTPTTTTPAPAVASCDFLTGRWQANDPTATLCMTVDASNGRLTGLVRNATDNYFIEINGRTLATSTDTLGFNGIWPLRLAVSGFAGECHNCFGTERILVDTLSRSNLVSPDCGIPGPFQYSASYTFFRVSGSCTGSTMNVYRPTNISKNMGINVIDVTEEMDSNPTKK